MKNLSFLIERLRGSQGSVSLDIYGPIEDQQYWRRCEGAMASLPKNVSARYCGTIPHDDVASVLSCYDLFFLPTLAENHGHVIIEAACAGCPLLISDQTPWTDVSRRGAGWSLSLDNEKGFEDVLRYMLQCDDDTWRSLSESAVSYGLSKAADPALSDAYLDLFGVQPTRDH
jgi:glycosyltransferase involved in cell wall biosynthesis